MATSNDEPLVELNVGGVCYTTTLATLTKVRGSVLDDIFTGYPINCPVDSKGKYFLDRDGVLFRFILGYLRDVKLVLPECFQENERLRREALFFGLTEMANAIRGERPAQLMVDGHLYSPRTNSPATTAEAPSGKDRGYITVSYRGSFHFGKDGQDVKFRKVTRILVCGRVTLCREVFGDALNDSRDPHQTTDRYSSRFYLKTSSLEQAFELLDDAGFGMVGSGASGTNNTGELKPGMDEEEARWAHYNEFVFCRR